MKALKLTPLIITLLPAMPVSLLAQQAPPVAPGDRVRVTAPEIQSQRFVGTVIETGADTCLLKVEGRPAPLPLALAAVTQLEVSRGQANKGKTGAIIGGAVGAGIGVAVIISSYEEDCGSQFLSDLCETSNVLAVASPLVLGVAGALLGNVIGRSIKSERWEEVPLDRLRVGRSPVSADGVAIFASLQI